jgi:hypothetical protein
MTVDKDLFFTSLIDFAAFVSNYILKRSFIATSSRFYFIVSNALLGYNSSAYEWDSKFLGECEKVAMPIVLGSFELSGFLGET